MMIIVTFRVPSLPCHILIAEKLFIVLSFTLHPKKLHYVFLTTNNYLFIRFPSTWFIVITAVFDIDKNATTAVFNYLTAHEETIF